MTDARAFRGFRVGHVHPLSLIRDGEKITGGAVFGRPAPEIAPPSPRPRDHGRRPGDFLQQPHARPSPS